MIKSIKSSEQKFRIASLDGLRGLAILLVFLSHTSNEEIYLLPWANFSGVGKSGVYLFFILSSFLLTLPFIKKGSKAINLKYLTNYLFRRFWRIYPLYFLYLITAIITSQLWTVQSLLELSNIPFYLTFDDLGKQLLLAEGKGVTWSILVEFRYYFILPLLALTYSVILKNKLFPSTILTVILILVCQLLYPPSASMVNDSRLEPYLPIFLIGSLLALVFYKWNESSWKENYRVCWAIDIGGISALVILFCLTPAISSILLRRKIAFDYYHHNFILYACLWSVVLFSCLTGSARLKSWLEIFFLRYLGMISFSFYLIHTIFLHPDIISLIPHNFLQGWIILAITIVISHISWLLIEQPTSKVRLFQK